MECNMVRVIDTQEPPRVGTHPPTPSAQMLLNNHCHILLCIAEDPDVRLRDMADRVGITERAAFAIVKDLERAQIITRTRIGRRNQYTIDRKQKLHLPIGSSCKVGDLIETVLAPTS
jgi:hypothetical protein